MKENRKEFIFVIEKSERMNQESVIAGFNALVDAQKGIEDESTFTLFFFNDTFKPSAEGKSLKEMRKYNKKTYVPKSTSALYDAVGAAMVSAGERFAAEDESERPSQVTLIAVGTYDDASTTYTKEALAEMIAVQKYTYKWDFVFFTDDGESLGVNKGGKLECAKEAFERISEYMTSLR